MQLKQTSSEFKGCVDKTDNILHDAGGGSMSRKPASSSCDLIRSEKLRGHSGSLLEMGGPMFFQA